MPMTEEAREYHRSRYAARCQDEAYREKVRQWGRDNYIRKKERLAGAGVAPKPRGRPRKYISIVAPNTTHDSNIKIDTL